MTAVAQYVLAGLALGAIYAIASASLVVTYVSAGVLNFAFGSMAFVVARFYNWLNSEHGWGTNTAGAMSLLGFPPLLGIVAVRSGVPLPTRQDDADQARRDHRRVGGIATPRGNGVRRADDHECAGACLAQRPAGACPRHPESADNCSWVTELSGSAFKLVAGADRVCGQLVPGKTVSP